MAAGAQASQLDPVTISDETQRELLALHDRFTRVEAESLVPTVGDGQPLVVRLDGVKASKRHLKDVLRNAAFADALAEAIQVTYRLWRDWAPEEHRPYLLAALALSDEVSFLVNQGPNYYARRVLKICTTLCGTLSAAATIAFARRAGGRRRSKGDRRRETIIAFDARPILVRDSGAVSDYCRWRQLLACRNAMARALRLRSDLADRLYEGDQPLADNIHALSIEVGRRGLWDAYGEATQDFRWFAADAEHRLQEERVSEDPSDDFTPGWDLRGG